MILNFNMLTENPPPHPAGSRQFPTQRQPASQQLQLKADPSQLGIPPHNLTHTAHYTLYIIYYTLYTLCIQSKYDVHTKLLGIPPHNLTHTTNCTLYNSLYKIQNTHTAGYSSSQPDAHYTLYIIHYAFYIQFTIHTKLGIPYMFTHTAMHTVLSVVLQCGNWGGIIAKSITLVRILEMF